ncbi:DNA primase [Halobellus salinus]|uniref:DNA primase large subunit PriL n=1 Tax=Halobellus salinus TaxID=931585 RepID=A0A830EBD4_9EURY|nr:DNA primase [Halobellus salinus]GGJ08600.1 DNA primase [Halobellus salinus]SMP28287.1 DNA primase large subunit [Halobellus salinus]
MDPRYARYPFFEGAREAVREAELSPAALVRDGAPAVERGRERVERALMEGTVASETPRRWDTDTEVLSYPIARILVSLIDTPAAVEKYAVAEAATARERFDVDFAADDDLGRAGRARASHGEVLREFDIADAVRPERAEPPGSERRGASSRREPTHYWVGLGSYLDLAEAGWGQRWRLVNREVAAGEVRVTAGGLSRLLEAAVERRVASGLPFEVRGSDGGDAIAAALAPAVADLRELLNDHDAAGRTPVDAVVPALFPPCMRTLLQRARDDGDLPTTAEFSLTSFLVALGMDGADVRRLLDADGDTAERIGTRVEYLAERDGTQYPPPSCATMKAYGDCVDPDDRCETISHPLSYYTDAVREAGDVRDWREAAGEG